jgi:hypothetical protein
MGNATVGFALDTLLRKKIEKLRRKEKDVRIHNRLSVLLWSRRWWVWAGPHRNSAQGANERWLRGWREGGLENGIRGVRLKGGRDHLTRLGKTRCAPV